MASHIPADVVTAVQAYLQYLRRLGVTELAVTLPPHRGEALFLSTPVAASRSQTPRSTAAEAPSSSAVSIKEEAAPRQMAAVPGEASVAIPAAAPLGPVSGAEEQLVATAFAPLLTGATAGERLRQLAETVRDCQQCRLHQGRKQVVFGSGNPEASLVFVGEAPGRDEDLQGEPFVGAAGQLLNRIIAAIGLKRQHVYILNVIKCRPPNNRDPLPDEIAACRPIVRAQLGCLQPQVICTLGSFATRTLLQTEERISRLRGRFHQMGTIQVMPTYHPAFLLRNPQYKRAVWEDMQKIQRALALPAQAGSPED